jgi:hypothetical protein
MRMHRPEPAAEVLSASVQSAEAAVVQSAEAAAQVATGAHAVMDPRATSSPAGAPPSPCDDAPSLQHETALHVPRHHDEAEAQRRTQIGNDEAEAQRRTQIGGDEAEAQRRIRIGQLELRWPRQSSGD